MATPKRLTSRSRSISASTWNQYADAVTRFNSPENGTGPSPEYTENLAFAKTDGDFIPPHTVCRIVARYNLEEKDPSLVGYVVRELQTGTEVGGKPANYAITGSEGVDKESGSVYVSGMAIVKVTMEEAVSGEGILAGYDVNNPENQYEGQHDAAYYIAKDLTLSSASSVRIAPFGHFKITSFYIADDFEGAESLFLCVNMDRPSTTIRVVTTESIPAVSELEEEVDPTPEEPDSGDETMEPTGEVVMTCKDAKVFYSMEATTPTTDTQSVQKNDNWHAKVFNVSGTAIPAGVHTATYSREYNCFVVLVSAPSASVFPIEMTWDDPEAEGNSSGDGGLQGTFNSAASWTYSIKLFEGDGTYIEEDYDIVAPPNHYRRPTGQMTKATYGLATYDNTGALVVISCNETIISATC